MDRTDFISQIISLYPHAIKDYRAQFDTYARALKVSLNVDYEMLMDLFSQEYKESFPPAPGILTDMAKRCIKNFGTEPKNKQVAFRDTLTGLVRSTDAFDGNFTNEQLLNWKIKQSGHNNWELVEVY